MCRLITDGVVSRGCGHYTQTFVAAVADCQSPTCKLSSFHNPACRNPACNSHYGPDIERTTNTASGLCGQCLNQPRAPAPRARGIA